MYSIKGEEVVVTDIECDTRSQGNFLYGKKQSVFSVLDKLYNYCYKSARIPFIVSGLPRNVLT